MAEDVREGAEVHPVAARKKAEHQPGDGNGERDARNDGKVPPVKAKEFIEEIGEREGPEPDRGGPGRHRHIMSEGRRACLPGERAQDPAQPVQFAQEQAPPQAQPPAAGAAVSLEPVRVANLEKRARVL